MAKRRTAKKSAKKRSAKKSAKKGKGKIPLHVLETRFQRLGHIIDKRGGDVVFEG